MIARETIDRILDAVRIDEVVGDFVQLKKRGTNLLGLCPFHNEKTPSFNVNPVRNIYKCFGCGKGGDAVNFVMEHEHYSYPEALRYLAKRYNIEIEETAPDPQEAQLRDERESLYILNSYAQRVFSEQLFEDEEGRAIGMSYFRERGFTEETIKTFQLGFSRSDWSAFAERAVKEGYKEEYLEKTGLCIRKDNGKLFDRFRGRVMFPIHNLSGRVIGFGGRVLKKDDKTAKYLNSPESEIYHKSKSLYGIYFAKKAIVQLDNCYLVEGYTDVISLHQAGIENVVASSGTSLTSEQIRLIGRYTKNITVLYDGDAAGIKASLRGIDLILEEGLNVKVVLFPDGDDPDSYTRKHGSSSTVDFIEANAKDFVLFKTGLLLDDVKNDPVRKAGLIRDVVETIGHIPDPILRSTYTKQCSALLDIQENILVSELNKIRRNQLKKETGAPEIDELLTVTIAPPQTPADDLSTEAQEQHIIRLLVQYGEKAIEFKEDIEDPERPGHYVKQVHHVSVSRFIVEEIAHDGIEFEHPVYNRLLRLYVESAKANPDASPDVDRLIQESDASVREVLVELLSPRYTLSDNWAIMHQIEVPLEENLLRQQVEQSVYHLKNKKVMRLLEESRQRLKEAHTNGEDFTALLERHQHLERVKQEISRILGIDVLR
ncbi:MAG TPA: DNA primase [Bacteroidia bacterium]|nr:DNA primase [Bacteroidia bacterium]